MVPFDTPEWSAYLEWSNSNSLLGDCGGTEKQLMQVFDVTGKLMLSQFIQNGKSLIDASSLSQGIYNVCLSGNEGVINKRLVIVR
jgi:hypothetical protein